ncbi:MAG: 50S ribosomal protein L10 [Bdellovibrionota bacterium]|nr:50S ribosomal protein L10 [Deltaproteobacteria bacterium]
MAGANLRKKQEFVGAVHDRFKTVRAAVVSHYAGTTVGEMTTLREKLREEGIELKVLKNTLAKIAIKDTELEVLTDHFSGPTAVAYTDEHPVSLAKALYEFAKKNKNFQIQAGVLRGQLLEKTQVEELANTPSREVLLGRLVGSLQNPISGFVYVNSGILRKAVYALDAIRRDKESKEG